MSLPQEKPMKKTLVALSVMLTAWMVCPPGFLTAGQQDERIRAVTDEVTPGLIAIRRDIHAHPELGFQEKRTSAIVADYFRKLGLDVRTGIASTGVLGILKGSRPGPVVAMRADMDALPITEETGLPFASLEKAVSQGREVGVMHACGHDVHTTILLGVASVLARLRTELPGTVLFIAQPSEETEPGGANAMIEAGVFDALKPEAIFAYHVDDTLETGFIGYTPGWASANVDDFHLVIKSPGGHGANPELCVDPIVVGAQIVIGLQVMVSREISVHDHTVITVGYFHAGTAENIIPESAELRATVRTYGEDQRRLVKDKIGRLVTNICEAGGAGFDLDYAFGSPSVYNDPDLTDQALSTAERLLGGRSFLVEEKPEMGGEDFSFFSQIAPSVMLYLGVVPRDMKDNYVHTPAFVVDEAGIPIGIRVMSAIIFDYQARRSGRN